MFRCHLVALVVLACSTLRADEPALTPNSADEPVATAYSLEKAARFLDQVASEWTRQRQCGTCHTNYAYMIARPALATPSSEMNEVREFFERRVAGWDNPEKAAKPRWDAEVVATAAALAIHDAKTTGTLHPLTRKALDRIWKLQNADGAWEWLKCDWPPYEHDDYYGAVFAAVGVGHAPDGYRDTPAARAGIEKLRGYLRAHPAPSLHHKAFLLWASTRLDGLMSSSEQQAAIAELLAAQRPDGGWNLPSLGDWQRHDKTPNDPNGPSDGYGTGLVVFVLRQAGLTPEHEAIRRGTAWLKSHQRVSGRWFTRSVSTDKAHYITHAGTAFALLALESCGAP